MGRGLLHRVLGQVFPQDYLIGTTVPVIQHQYLVNLVQVNGHADMVPKRLIPGWEFVGQGAQGCPRQDDMVIFAGQATAGHVAGCVVQQAEIHAAQQQGVCLPSGTEVRYWAEHGQTRCTPSPEHSLQELTPTVPGHDGRLLYMMESIGAIYQHVSLLLCYLNV